jgi:hypothetical protein
MGMESFHSLLKILKLIFKKFETISTPRKKFIKFQNSPIRGGPIKYIRELDMLSVIRTLKEVKHVELGWMFWYPRRNEMIFIENEIGSLCSVTIGCNCARVDGTFC